MQDLDEGAAGPHIETIRDVCAVHSYKDVRPLRNCREQGAGCRAQGEGTGKGTATDVVSKGWSADAGGGSQPACSQLMGATPGTKCHQRGLSGTVPGLLPVRSLVAFRTHLPQTTSHP